VTDKRTRVPETDRTAQQPSEPAERPARRRSAELGTHPPPADLGARRPTYKGEELDAARGPGLGCFWFQAAVLAVFLVLIPVGLTLNWPYEVLAALLFIALGLLLFVGQTLIFLLRLVAADRRDAGRRRPLASPTPTVGQLEDAASAPSGEDGLPAGQPAAAAQVVTALLGDASDATGRGAPPPVEPGPEGVRE
jgi:hypothetical protein